MTTEKPYANGNIFIRGTSVWCIKLVIRMYICNRACLICKSLQISQPKSS